VQQISITFFNCILRRGNGKIISGIKEEKTHKSHIKEKDRCSA
jgi:hypothetical protein